jgi:hypothetical protein
MARRSLQRTPLIVLTVAAVAVASVALDAGGADEPLDATLRRVAAYVQSYYSRAQSIVAQETVTVQNVTRDMAGDGFARRFVYSLRVDWVPADAGPPDATLARELVTVNGRTPREGDEPHCTAPKAITPEPLAMFLPERQPDFVFDRPARTRLDGRAVTRIDYRIRRPEPDKVSWDRDCVNMDFPSRLRGRAWIDESTGAVLRIDEGANGPVDMVRPREQQRRGAREMLVFSRWIESIRYRPVTFAEPDETLLLPASIESVAMAGSGGTRRVQTYSNYRRFVTEGRVVQ